MTQTQTVNLLKIGDILEYLITQSHLRFTYLYVYDCDGACCVFIARKKGVRSPRSGVTGSRELYDAGLLETPEDQVLLTAELSPQPRAL